MEVGVESFTVIVSKALCREDMASFCCLFRSNKDQKRACSSDNRMNLHCLSNFRQWGPVLNQRHPQNNSREQSRNRYNRNKSIQPIETQDQMELDLKNGEGAVSYRWRHNRRQKKVPPPSATWFMFQFLFCFDELFLFSLIYFIELCNFYVYFKYLAFFIFK